MKPTRESLIAFELQIREDFKAGRLPFLVHFCGGNEGQLLDLFHSSVRPGDWIFSTHRAHYHYLLAGGDPDKLRGMIHAGKSMFIYDRALNFLTSSVLGGMAAIAAGVAWEIREGFCHEGQNEHPAHMAHVHCFLGDGAEDNGHLYEAALFVHAHSLPCTFHIEDNGFSVDAPLSERTRNKRHVWPACVRRYEYKRTYPHAGPGLKEMIRFDPAVVEAHAQKPLCTH